MRFREKRLSRARIDTLSPQSSSSSFYLHRVLPLLSFLSPLHSFANRCHTRGTSIFPNGYPARGQILSTQISGESNDNVRVSVHVTTRRERRKGEVGTAVSRSRRETIFTVDVGLFISPWFVYQRSLWFINSWPRLIEFFFYFLAETSRRGFALSRFVARRMGRDYREEKNMVDDKDTKRKKLFRTTNDKSYVVIIINNDWNNMFSWYLLFRITAGRSAKRLFVRKKIFRSLSLSLLSLLVNSPFYFLDRRDRKSREIIGEQSAFYISGIFARRCDNWKLIPPNVRYRPP